MFPARFIPFKRSTHEKRRDTFAIDDFRMFRNRMLINRRYFFFEFLQNLENWKRISIGKNDLIVLIYICIYRFEHNDCECRKDSIVCRPLYSRRGAIDIIEKAR